jgi:sugar-specific transcriptional regulator TrmB
MFGDIIPCMRHLAVDEYLKHIGFSEKETDVYSHLLSSGMSTPLEISRAIGMKRSTVYAALNELISKGLAREVKRGKKDSFIAEDPERIKTLLEESRRKTEEMSQVLSEHIPRIRAGMRQGSDAPTLKFYQGRDAVRASMIEFVHNPGLQKDLDYGVFSLDVVHELFGNRDWVQYVTERVNENDVYKVIYTADEGELPRSHFKESIKIDQKTYPLTCDIGIYKDQVRIHMMGDNPYGIAIESRQLAETLASLIRLAMDKGKN